MDIVISKLVKLFSLFGSPGGLHSNQGSQFESSRFKHFLLQNGMVKTWTTPNHPQGNGQCEHMNGTISKTVSLALHTQNLCKNQWSTLLPLALASIHGLLCTETNKTPHEAMFYFPCSSKFDSDLLAFLTKLGSTVLHHCHIQNKGELPTEKVTLLETLSPHFSQVQFSNS